MIEESGDRRSLSRTGSEQLSPRWRYTGVWKATGLIFSVSQTGRGGAK